jgi:hypothetical protein
MTSSDKNASTGQAGQANSNGDGADPFCIERDAPEGRRSQARRRVDWTLPPALMHLVRMQGEPSQELLQALITRALQLGADEDNIVKACLESEPPYGGSIYKQVQANGGEDYVKRVIASIVNATPTRAERRVIAIRQWDAHYDTYWRQVEEALIAAKCPVFVRNKILVQPLWDWHKDQDDRNILSIELESYNLVQLTDMVQHHAVNFQKFNRRGQLIDVNPPEKLMNTGLGIHHYTLPKIIGVTTSPIMRPDLSLVTEPGYDAVTQVWYKPSDNVQLPPRPEHSTRADAMKALKLLNDLLDGFPFEGETKEEKKSVSRSAALAGIMTTVARGALKAAVPLFFITAPDARTGKTYLVHLIALIATGHIPISNAGSEDNTEFEKRVETAAMAARPIMHFGNLPEYLVVKSVRLAQLSTEGYVKIRKLGRHEEGQCDCRATTAFLDGNNLLLSGDLVPRAVSCRLNAQMEHPEERTFNSEPHQLVRANRGAYLNAVYTIIWAFVAAGAPRPKEYKKVTGFEQWSRLIQQSLMWLGMEDSLGTMEAMRAIDPGEENLQRLLKVLQQCLTKEERRSFTVAVCEDKANEVTGNRDQWGYLIFKYPELRELMSLKGQINGRHFGRLLMNMRDKIRGEWCIRLSDEKGKSNIYYLLGPDEPPATTTNAAAGAANGEGPM